MSIEPLSGVMKVLFEAINRMDGTNDLLDQLDKQITRDQLPKVLASIAEMQEMADIWEWKKRKSGGVFISYSHADKEFVSLLSRSLRNDSINYWLDEKDLLVGEVIDKAISNGIQRSQVFIIVLSPNSIKSKWVEREFNEASYEEIEGRKVILPVIINYLKANELPPRLRGKYFVDFTKNFEDGYKKLKKSILFYMMDSSQGIK